MILECAKWEHDIGIYTQGNGILIWMYWVQFPTVQLRFGVYAKQVIKFFDTLISVLTDILSNTHLSFTHQSVERPKMNYMVIP